MRVIKAILLLAFFFVSMLFFVQNDAILQTPLVLKLGAFGLAAETPAVPFYIVLLMAFFLGGLIVSLYFLAEKVRLAATARRLSNKIKALEKQLANVATAAQSATPEYAKSSSSVSVASGESAADAGEHGGA
jgi:lipopolysaccharide assembly protein A